MAAITLTNYLGLEIYHQIDLQMMYWEYMRERFGNENLMTKAEAVACGCDFATWCELRQFIEITDSQQTLMWICKSELDKAIAEKRTEVIPEICG